MWEDALEHVGVLLWTLRLPLHANLARGIGGAEVSRQAFMHASKRGRRPMDEGMWRRGVGN